MTYSRVAICILVLVAMAWGSQSSFAADSSARLNVLLIVVDDMNNALGCYGHPIVKSPNLERLAAPACDSTAPTVITRCAMLRARRCSVDDARIQRRFSITTSTHASNSAPISEFLPEYFRAHGYLAKGVGKIPHTPEHAASITWDYYDDPGAVSDAEKKRRKRSGRDQRQQGQESPLNARRTTARRHYRGRAVKFLEEPRDKPLFLAVGLHRPHEPRIAPQKYFDLYPPETLPPFIEPPGHAAGIPKIANPPQYAPDWSEAKCELERQANYACATFMDAQVGVLLDAMDRLKLWGDTVVIFCSDHGLHLGEHGGFWGKQSLMEESVRVPLIVHAPGRKAGVASSRLVELVDIFPSVVDLCGLPTPPGLEGTSFAPLLDAPQQPWKQAVLAVVQRDKKALGRSVRSGAVYLDRMARRLDATLRPRARPAGIREPRVGSAACRRCRSFEAIARSRLACRDAEKMKPHQPGRLFSPRTRLVYFSPCFRRGSLGGWDEPNATIR